MPTPRECPGTLSDCPIRMLPSPLLLPSLVLAFRSPDRAPLCLHHRQQPVALRVLRAARQAAVLAIIIHYVPSTPGAPPAGHHAVPHAATPTLCWHHTR